MIKLINERNLGVEAEIDARHLTFEAGLRVVLLLMLFCAEKVLKQATRLVKPEEWWKYRYPYTGTSSAQTSLSYAAIVICPIIFFVYLFVIRNRTKPKEKVLHKGVPYFLALTGSLLVTLIICVIIKKFYGRLRPDFLSRCYNEVRIRKLGAIAENLRINSPPQCVSSADISIIENGKGSFPSASMASAVSVSTVMAYWGYTHWNRINSGGVESIAIALGLMACPIWVMVATRPDYNHHFTDDIAGILVASMVSYGAIRLYLPSADENKDSMRIGLANGSNEV